MTDALRIALAELGTAEIEPGSNPRIDEYLRTVGLSDDDTPWCAAFVNWALSAAGVAGTGKANARSFLTWGVKALAPQPGDVAVFWRDDPASWKGHVAFYLSRNAHGVWVVGGNQGNAVSVRCYSESQLLDVRRIE